MKTKLFKSLSLLFLFVTLMSVSVLADDEVSIYAGSSFAAGSNVTVDNQNAQDIFVAGQSLDVDNSRVKGNVFAAASMVDISDLEVGADIFAAGQNVDIKKTSLGGNVFAAGQSVNISDVEASSVFAAAGTIYFDGKVEDACFSGEKVEFNGYAEGDISIEANEVVIGDDAVVNGTLSVKAASNPQIPSGAAVNNLEYEELKDDNAETVAKVSIFVRLLKKIASSFYWMAAMALVGLVLCFVCGSKLDEAKELIATKPIEIVMSGALGWICIPVISIVLAVTIIGLPLAAIISLIYVGVLWIGLTFAGASLGRLVFPKLHPILASIIGIVVLEFVRIIPVIGGFVGVVADMYLIGYIIYVIRSSYASKHPKLIRAVALDEPPVFDTKSDLVNDSAVSDEVVEDTVVENTVVESTSEEGIDKE